MGSSAFLFDGEFTYKVTGSSSKLDRKKLSSIQPPRSDAVFVSLYSSLWIISWQASHGFYLSDIYSSFDLGLSWNRADDISVLNGDKLLLARSKTAGIVHENRLCLVGGEKSGSFDNSILCSIRPASPPPNIAVVLKPRADLIPDKILHYWALFKIPPFESSGFPIPLLTNYQIFINLNPQLKNTYSVPFNVSISHQLSLFVVLK